MELSPGWKSPGGRACQDRQKGEDLGVGFRTKKNQQESVARVREHGRESQRGGKEQGTCRPIIKRIKGKKGKKNGDLRGSSHQLYLGRKRARRYCWTRRKKIPLFGVNNDMPTK